MINSISYTSSEKEHNAYIFPLGSNVIRGQNSNILRLLFFYILVYYINIFHNCVIGIICQVVRTTF